MAYGFKIFSEIYVWLYLHCIYSTKKIVSHDRGEDGIPLKCVVLNGVSRVLITINAFYLL